MGYLMVNVQLPDSASIERTDEVMRQIDEIALQDPGHQARHRHCRPVVRAERRRARTSARCSSTSRSMPMRRDPALSSDAIANTLRSAVREEIQEAQIAVFGPPPVRGVGRAGGFAMMVEDRGDVGPPNLQKQTDNLVRKGTKTPGLGRPVLGLPGQRAAVCTSSPTRARA